MGVGGRVGGGTCGSGEEKGPDPEHFAMSGEILPLDANSSSAEETLGRTWAQRPFPLQPGPNVSCGRRSVTGAARRGQALGQVQGHAPQSCRRLFLVPRQKRKKLELPPGYCAPALLAIFTSESLGSCPAKGGKNEKKGGRWREAGVILLPLRKKSGG